MASKKNKSYAKRYRQKTKNTEQPVYPAPPTPTNEERLIACGLAQLEAEEPYLWRKILNFD